MFTFISNADNTIVEKYNIDNKIRLNESLLNSKFTNRFAKNIMFTFTSNVDNKQNCRMAIEATNRKQGRKSNASGTQLPQRNAEDTSGTWRR